MAVYRKRDLWVPESHLCVGYGTNRNRAICTLCSTCKLLMQPGTCPFVFLLIQRVPVSILGSEDAEVERGEPQSIHGGGIEKGNYNVVGAVSQEDPLEEGMATHCIILAWRIPWTEEPGGPQSMRSQKSCIQLNSLSKYACSSCKGARGGMLWDIEEGLSQEMYMEWEHLVSILQYV